MVDKEDPDEYEVDTNKQEQFELLGRIAYIIDVIIKKYKSVKLFVVGFSRRNRPKIYKKIFDNLFSYKFDLYYGDSRWHLGESLFIIRK